MYELSLIPRKNRVYLDEAGANLAMTPLFAWSPKNTRAYDKKPANRGGNISMIGAIKDEGLKAIHPYDGAINEDKFIHFLENKLAPTLKKGDVIIMDNISFHHSKKVKQKAKDLFLDVLYLPPYTPELNPIEEMWSVIKNKLRQLKSRTIPDFVDALMEASMLIDKDKCNGFFMHAESFGNFR